MLPNQLVAESFAGYPAEARRIAGTLPVGTVEIARPPELLDLPALRAGTEGEVIVLHPDPELSAQERDILKEVDKQLRLFTPTTAFAGGIGRAIHAPLRLTYRVARNRTRSRRVGRQQRIRKPQLYRPAEHRIDSICG